MAELEVGFRALLAAASRHEVWVLTNTATIPIVRRAIQEYPWADRVHFEGIYFDVDDELYPQLSTPGFHRCHDRWQRKAAVRAVELDAHQLRRRSPRHTRGHGPGRGYYRRQARHLGTGRRRGRDTAILLAGLGWRGLVDETGRVAARRLLMQIGPARLIQQRAFVVRTEYRYGSGHPDTRTDARTVRCNRGRRPGCAGCGSTTNRHHFRGTAPPWKGGRLAVRTMRFVRHPEAVLRIFGDGQERRRMARAARRWGVADRVRFEGSVPRDELLRIVATAGVFFHPAFHDEAGLAVARSPIARDACCLPRSGAARASASWPSTCADAVTPESPEKPHEHLRPRLIGIYPTASRPHKRATIKHLFRERVTGCLRHRVQGWP